MEDKASTSMGPACLHCPAYELEICRAAVAARGVSPREPVAQVVRSGSARRVILRDRDLQDVVPFICDGWASRDVRVSGGGRMILSFFLPGDLISDALFVESPHGRFIEAITDVQYRVFNRSALRRILFDCAEALEVLLRTWAEEKKQCEQLLVDIGQRSAEIRITRLILRLIERLKARGLEAPNAQQVTFPLRHHHIADATGLTSVHVTKVLSELRRRHVLEVGGRTLSILDPVALNRIASL